MLAMALGVPTAMAHILELDQEDSISLLHIVVVFLPPFFAFAFLGFRSIFSPRSSYFPALVGAAACAFLAIAIPYGWAWYETAQHFPGGANIGLGLVLLAVPFLMMCAMIVGWNLGKSMPHRARSSRCH